MVIWASLLTFRHLRLETLDSSQATHTAPWFFRWGSRSDANVESKLVLVCLPFFPERFHTLYSVMRAVSLKGLLHAVCQGFTAFLTTYIRPSPCFFRPTSVTVGEIYSISGPFTHPPHHESKIVKFQGRLRDCLNSIMFGFGLKIDLFLKVVD